MFLPISIFYIIGFPRLVRGSLSGHGGSVTSLGCRAAGPLLARLFQKGDVVSGSRPTGRGDFAQVTRREGLAEDVEENERCRIL